MGVVGKKVGMTQFYQPSGAVIPVTVIQAGPCPVVQKKTKDKDGADAVQVAFDPCGEKRATKARVGHFKKAGVTPHRVLREFRVDDPDSYKVGEQIGISMFQEGDRVDVTGLTKGKGFTGVMKRWGFAGGPASHGAHRWHRRPGSIGSNTFPSRVFKGMRMAGHAGARRLTARNLQVVSVDQEKGILAVNGAVPGFGGGYLVISKAKGARRGSGSVEQKA